MTWFILWFIWQEPHLSLPFSPDATGHIRVFVCCFRALWKRKTPWGSCSDTPTLWQQWRRFSYSTHSFKKPHLALNRHLQKLWHAQIIQLLPLALHSAFSISLFPLLVLLLSLSFRSLFSPLSSLCQSQFCLIIKFQVQLQKLKLVALNVSALTNKSF